MVCRYDVAHPILRFGPHLDPWMPGKFPGLCSMTKTIVESFSMVLGRVWHIHEEACDLDSHSEAPIHVSGSSDDLQWPRTSGIKRRTCSDNGHKNGSAILRRILQVALRMSLEQVALSFDFKPPKFKQLLQVKHD